MVEQQTGRRPEQLEGPELPDELRYLWNWFVMLSNRRGGTGFGPAALTPVMIVSWCQLNRMSLLPYELEAIEALDDLYMAQQTKDAKKKAA